MIPRHAEKTLLRLSKGFPVLAITGPRQSGKTTLARHLFTSKPYATLENPETRLFATEDPKGFLAQYQQGAILDEVQRVPSLLSWLQGLVDERQKMADFIITGSAQFELIQAVNQSLAGRVGRVELLPLQASELEANGLLAESVDDCILRGGYPALFSREIEFADWFANYSATYVERDVRQILAIKDLTVFQRFITMAAGRSGQLLNMASLASDVGVSVPTITQWITVLEASYLAMHLPPYFENLGKRLTKSPKLYFLDTGLLCWLLGIRDAKTLQAHPLRGAIFETYLVAEYHKSILNQGRTSNFFFYRDSHGVEIDLLSKEGNRIELTEIKSGQTFSPSWIKPLCKVGQLMTENKQQTEIKQALIYGGDESYDRQSIKVIDWRRAVLELKTP